MEFKLLGPLEMGTGGRSHAPTAPMPRQVLALLALRANQVVSTQSLTDELWPESPPASVATTLQTYVYQLRKKLGEPIVIGSGWGAVQVMERPEIVTRPPGYVLLVPPEKIDVHRFARLADQGAKARKDGVLESAAYLLREGLGLWRGSALSDVVIGPVLQNEVAYLEERRTAAMEHLFEVALLLGQYREIIVDLRRMVEENRLHERFHGYLIMALLGSGRRAEALEAFRSLRATLAEELGLSPSHELEAIHQCVLQGRLPDPLLFSRP
ncbi:AfsR/SARP family transcriptional regulator [Nocardiopsis alba]|jgi:DNA-binding SARP family transcriptional activator|uniref:AfsR/SARP family transcriptional regulator n=1 Tax=Nocardiopsis alba TaxID=53437 RepID=UPI0033A5F228